MAPLPAAGLIGCVTFALSAAGVMLGRIAGDRWGSWAERAGGVILIGLGAKILAEHTGWLPG
jgi:putative Mn2+ efflux pump MntP